jgi:XTP/dITP diphosphohydrolase
VYTQQGMQENNTIADDNMNKLLKDLSNENNRRAQFKTVIALNYKGTQHLFTGIAKVYN